MAVNQEEILETISNMTVVEVVTLIEAMEEKFGVSAASMAAPAVAVVGDAGGAAVEEQTQFDVILTGFGDAKVAIIKAVRGITGLGLKEAKDAVESAPTTIKEAASKEEADALVAQITEAGGTAELK